MPEVKYCPYCGRSLTGTSEGSGCLSEWAYNYYYCVDCPANGGKSLKFTEPEVRKVD